MLYTGCTLSYKTHFTMKTFLLLILILVILAGLFFFMKDKANVAPSGASTDATSIVEDYVKQNISSLSPEKEVLGGTFYVTNIEAQEGTGTVKYEDGHVAYIADFTYTIEENGIVNITSFKTRK
jgi:hypothetical protein